MESHEFSSQHIRSHEQPYARHFLSRKTHGTHFTGAEWDSEPLKKYLGHSIISGNNVYTRAIFFHGSIDREIRTTGTIR